PRRQGAVSAYRDVRLDDLPQEVVGRVAAAGAQDRECGPVASGRRRRVARSAAGARGCCELRIPADSTSGRSEEDGVAPVIITGATSACGDVYAFSTSA